MSACNAYANPSLHYLVLATVFVREPFAPRGVLAAMSAVEAVNIDFKRPPVDFCVCALEKAQPYLRLDLSVKRQDVSKTPGGYLPQLGNCPPQPEGRSYNRLERRSSRLVPKEPLSSL
jgi:hypothetical protein